jgi:hypothetical protein
LCRVRQSKPSPRQRVFHGERYTERRARFPHGFHGFGGMGNLVGPCLEADPRGIARRYGVICAALPQRAAVLWRNRVVEFRNFQGNTRRYAESQESLWIETHVARFFHGVAIGHSFPVYVRASHRPQDRPLLRCYLYRAFTKGRAQATTPKLICENSRGRILREARHIGRSWMFWRRAWDSNPRRP